MSASVIVLGFDSVVLDDSEMGDAVRAQYQFEVIVRCKFCPNTQRVVFPPSGPAVQFLDHKEVKPRETYVLRFVDGAHASTWLNDKVGVLSGKVVYMTDPALQT